MPARASRRLDRSDAGRDLERGGERDTGTRRSGPGAHNLRRSTMPVEINELNATTRLGAPSGESRIPEADVERIARRVIEILAQRERITKMARPEHSARSEERSVGTEGVVRVDHGGRRTIKKKK